MDERKICVRWLRCVSHLTPFRRWKCERIIHWLLTALRCFPRRHQWGRWKGGGYVECWRGVLKTNSAQPKAVVLTWSYVESNRVERLESLVVVVVERGVGQSVGWWYGECIYANNLICTPNASRVFWANDLWWLIVSWCGFMGKPQKDAESNADEDDDGCVRDKDRNRIHVEIVDPIVDI